jgi:hypothetical protein
MLEMWLYRKEDFGLRSAQVRCRRLAFGRVTTRCRHPSNPRWEDDSEASEVRPSQLRLGLFPLVAEFEKRGGLFYFAAHVPVHKSTSCRVLYRHSVRGSPYHLGLKSRRELVDSPARAKAAGKPGFARCPCCRQVGADA